MKLVLTIGLFVLCSVAMATGENGFPQQIQIMEQGSVKTVPNAVVYVEELDKEFVTDSNGALNINLEKGSYTLYVSSLGFEEQVISLKVNKPSFQSVLLANAPSSISSSSFSAER